jgi:hypothetical protein
MQNTQVTKSDLLPNEVQVDLDVLRASMMDWICCHVH